MEHTVYQQYLALLHEEIAPALGCTEPAAVALCTAQAAQLAGEFPQRLQIEVSAYILKNAMNVGIPGTDETGLAMAAAMGAASASPQQKLLVLRGLTAQQIACAHALIEKGAVSIAVADTPEKVYIQVKAFGTAHSASATISGTHTHFVSMERDGQVLEEAACGREIAPEPTAQMPELTVKKILAFAAKASEEDLSFLKELVETNREIAQEGICGTYGLGVGRGLLHAGALMGQDAANYAVCITAAAADARMSGCEKPVMSVAGSGNQGLTATLPIIALAQRDNTFTTLQMYRSLAVSILVTVHAKHFIGRLSVLCGCAIAAAIGVVCGVVTLYGGDEAAVGRGIRTMVADISGMVCDGAKPGCALKIATSVSAAMRAASLALAGQGATSQDGIVETDVEKTLRNLGDLGVRGMPDTNQTILEMLLCKEQERSA